jgi:aminoglycoside phosphotransferase (APT) family kinase protein
MGMGDPACDVLPAWAFLPAETREAFRDAVGVDEATWARGRGWALCFGLVALPYYRLTNPTLAGIAGRAIDAVLADW